MQARRRLLAALCLSLAALSAQLAYGVAANSVAIISASLHLLPSMLGFAGAAFAASWAKRRSSGAYSFGYHRLEVCGCVGGLVGRWVRG